MELKEVYDDGEIYELDGHYYLCVRGLNAFKYNIVNIYRWIEEAPPERKDNLVNSRTSWQWNNEFMYSFKSEVGSETADEWKEYEEEVQENIVKPNYIVMDQRNEYGKRFGHGDIFTTKHPTLEEANGEALRQWLHMTKGEQKARQVEVVQAESISEYSIPEGAWNSNDYEQQKKLENETEDQGIDESFVVNHLQNDINKRSRGR